MRGRLTWLQRASLRAVAFDARHAPGVLPASAQAAGHLLRPALCPADLVHRLQSAESSPSPRPRPHSPRRRRGRRLLYACAVDAYDPQLTVIGVCLARLNVVFAEAVVRCRRTQCGPPARAGGSNTVPSTALQLIETLKANGGGGRFLRPLGREAGALEERPRRCRCRAGSSPSFRASSMRSRRRPILWIGGFRAMDGLISVGPLVAFQACWPVSPLRSPGLAGRVQHARAARQSRARQ